MPTPIFAAAGGLPMPLLPLDRQGGERVPNGETVLDLAQASARFRTTEDALRLLYFAAFEQLDCAGAMASVSADTLKEAVELSWLHRDYYSRLTREDFTRMVAFCRRKGVDPKKLWAYPVRRHMNGKFVIVFGLRIDAMRSIAVRTGTLQSIGRAEFVYAEDERRPFRAAVTVERRIDGKLIAFTASVDFDEVYTSGYWWDNKPAHMLETKAEKKALRKAFPDELGDVDGADDEISDRTEAATADGELTYTTE